MKRTLAQKRPNFTRLPRRPDMGLEIPHIWILTPLLFLLTGSVMEAQIVDNFEIRFQTQQNGGIQFLANTTMHCGFGNTCIDAQEALPFYELLIQSSPNDLELIHQLGICHSDLGQFEASN